MIKKYLLIGCLLAVCLQASAQESAFQVSRIWDQAPHNAFTDLIRYQGKFYCAFREGKQHVHGGNGKIRILVSGDGEHWESVALLEKEGYDLRDSKLSITPRGTMMVLMGGSVYKDEKLQGFLTHVAYSNEEGTAFSAPEPVKIEAGTGRDWLWKVTWHKGTGYGVVYRLQNETSGQAAFLVSTKDGLHYSRVCGLDVSGKPSEADICMLPDDTMLILLRRDGEGQTGLLGKSRKPYTRWTWKDTGLRLGGPELIRTSAGALLAGTRSFRGDYREGKAHTSVFLADTAGKLSSELVLPSGGDTSYPGMLEYGNMLWVSYYSSHEGKSAIYLARIPLEELQGP